MSKLLYSTYFLFLAHQLWYPTLATNPVCIKTSSTCFTQFGKNMSNSNYVYESGTSSIAFVTVPDDKIAKKLARGLVEQKLAACVNIISNIQSVYMWEGKMNEDSEYLMMIKTRTSRIEELSKWVRDNHPYSVAEVVTLPIENGNSLYMKWLAESVQDKK